MKLIRHKLFRLGLGTCLGALLVTNPTTTHGVESVDPSKAGKTFKKDPMGTSQLKGPIKLQAKDPIMEKDKSISLKVRSVGISGNKLFSKADLAPIYNPLIGKTVTLGDICKVRDELTQFYRKKGYILCQAALCAQVIDPKAGHVKFEIIEIGV